MFTTTTFFQLCRYCTVAVLGLFLHLGLMALLIEVAGIHYSVAFVVVLPITFVSKFCLDRYWTFRIRDVQQVRPLSASWTEVVGHWDKSERRRVETRTRQG